MTRLSIHDVQKWADTHRDLAEREATRLRIRLRKMASGSADTVVQDDPRDLWWWRGRESCLLDLEKFLSQGKDWEHGIGVRPGQRRRG